MDDKRQAQGQMPASAQKKTTITSINIEKVNEIFNVHN
jgi:hypothetical protein